MSASYYSRLSVGVSGMPRVECLPCDFDIGDHLTVYRDEQFHDPDYLFSQETLQTSRIDRIGYGYLVEEITFL